MTRTDIELNRRTFALVAIVWMVIGLLHALSRYADIVRYELAVEFTALDISYYVLSYAAWAIVTMTLLHTMQRPQFSFGLRKLSVLFVIGLSVWLPVYLSYDYGVSTLVYGGSWSDWLAKLTGTSVSIVYFYTVVYALTFAICGGVVLARRASAIQQANQALEQQRTRTALELAESQMLLMQSQLSPHFLFNCLGSLSFLARSSEKAALVDAIATLGSLLRFTVENTPKGVVTVSDEVGFVRDYLSLQQLRFGGRFVCTVSADEQAEHATCVPFSLQPLVENVFRHAVEKVSNSDVQGAPVRIQVDVSESGGRVLMTVCNSQLPAPDVAEPDARHGTGLRNLQTRLSHTYGSDYSLDTTLTDSDYCVCLTFPATVADDDP